MAEVLAREELIHLVRRIMAAEGDSQEEADRLVDLFLENVPHPEADGLIFIPNSISTTSPHPRKWSMRLLAINRSLFESGPGRRTTTRQNHSYES